MDICILFRVQEAHDQALPFVQPSAENGLGCRVTVYSYGRTNQRKLLNVYLGQCILMYTHQQQGNCRKLCILLLLYFYVIVTINIPCTIYTDTLIVYCMHIIRII